MSRVHFFATPKDLLAVCLVVEAKLDLQILPDFEMPKDAYPGAPVVYHRFADIPKLGIAPHHCRLVCPSYTLADNGQEIRPLTRARGSGFVIYLRATVNEAAVEFRPAGELEDGSIIMGEVMSHMTSKESEKIVRAFRTAMQKHFGKKARGAWIGPEALERLRAGARLTAVYTYAQPELMDIQIAEIEPKDDRT